MKIRMSVEPRNVDLFLRLLMEKYNYCASDKDDFVKVYNALRACITPYAVYRINHKVTGVRAIDDNQCSVVAMTLGAGVDRLSEYYKSCDNEKAYGILECMSDELLNNMYMEFNEAYVRFHRRYISRYIFVGNEISCDAIPDILEAIYSKKASYAAEEINGNDDIRVSESGRLEPEKSVVFYAILSDNPRAAM